MLRRSHPASRAVTEGWRDQRAPLPQRASSAPPGPPARRKIESPVSIPDGPERKPARARYAHLEPGFGLRAGRAPTISRVAVKNGSTTDAAIAMTSP